jgi:hypothetical protein
LKTIYFFNFEVHAKTLYKEIGQWLEENDSDLNKEFLIPLICRILGSVLGNNLEMNLALDDEDLAGELKWRS